MIVTLTENQAALVWELLDHEQTRLQRQKAGAFRPSPEDVALMRRDLALVAEVMATLEACSREATGL